jgi:hypothetical protein
MTPTHSSFFARPKIMIREKPPRFKPGPNARGYSRFAPGNSFSPGVMGTLSRFSDGVSGQGQFSLWAC